MLLDIKSAYDNINIHKLYESMLTYKILWHIHVLENLLTNKKIFFLMFDMIRKSEYL